jgi:N-acylglucosamine 2-epimerase
MRDQDGSLIDDDKAVWIQGRAAWMLSTLYNSFEQKPEWYCVQILEQYLNQNK